MSPSIYWGGTRWLRWLKHCTTTQKIRFPMLSLEFFIDIILLVESASNRNEYQEYFLGGKGGRCVGLTTLTPSRADCLEIWESQPTGNLWACNRPEQGLLYLPQSCICEAQAILCNRITDSMIPHHEERHNFYSSTNIIRIIKSKT